MMDAGYILLSCWITEAARSAVLSGRGHGPSGVRAAERARILAAGCTAEGIRIKPAFASGHAEWIADVAGAAEDTGSLGWFFLQRLGMYVDAHVGDLLAEAGRARLLELGRPDEEEVSAALEKEGLPPPPPPEWPEAVPAHAPGEARVRFGIIGDPHIGLDVSERLIPAAVDDLNQERVDFSVAIGDITQNGAADSFVRARAILDRLDAPCLVTLGNHDMWGGGGDRPVGRERFAAAFERAPYAVYEADGVRLVLIDSTDPEASPFPPFDLFTGAFTEGPNESVPGGSISPEVAEWMASIEPAGPTFIALHHPPHPYLGFPPLVFGLDEASTRLLADLATRIDAWGILCGHTHRSALHSLDGVPTIEVPSSKEWPFGYGMVEVSDEGWAFNLRPISDRALVERESAGLLFRRYARGPDEARAFSAAR